MNSTRIVFAMLASTWFGAALAGAEFIGLNLGNPAQPAYESSSFDLVDDLDVENPEQSSMILILEHPIEALPNIRYQGHNLDSSDNTTLNPEFSYNGATTDPVEQAAGSYDLDHDDIVLYYQLLNNWIDLDMGVDLKRFDGRISPTGADSSVDVDETIPLVHLSARVDLPISGFYVGADINASLIDVGISDSSAQDSTFLFGYEAGNGLGIEGGFKSFSLRLNDADDATSDLEYDGLFLNGYYSF